MKNETAEQWILLEQSGELGPVRRWLLRRHMAQHPELLDFQRDLLRISRDVRELKDVPELSRQAIAAIRVSADRQEGLGRDLPWQPALVVAALALFAIAGWFAFQPAPTRRVAETPKPAAAKSAELAWDDNIDKDITSLNKMLVTASDDLDETSDNSDIESTASELLQLEGSKI